MPAGHGQAHRAAAAGRAAPASSVLVVPLTGRSVDAQVGVRRRCRTCARRRPRPRAQRGQPQRAGVVGAGDEEPAGGRSVPDELLEGRVDRGGVAVVVEVVGLDVGDDGRVRAVDEERAVALVGLDDEQVAAAVVGVAGRLVEVAADGEGRVDPAVEAPRR